MRHVLAALAAIAVVALIAWAGTTHFSDDLWIGDDLEVVDDAAVGGNLAVTGTITGFSGENVTVAATLDSTCVVAGTFKALTASYFSKAVVCSSTVGVTGVLTASGGVTGALTGSAAGALGNFTVVESDTLKPGAGTAFYLRAKDGHNDADLNCADFSGNLTGNVTGDLTGNVSGNTSTLFQAVAEQGNLPTAGDNTGEFFKNTTGDTGWVADNDSWVQLWP